MSSSCVEQKSSDRFLMIDLYIIGYKVDTDISAATATLRIKMSEEVIGATLTVSATYSARPMAKKTITVTDTDVTLTLPLAEKHLWECGKGELYDLEFTLTKNGRTDRMTGYFGLREVKLSKEGGLQINGETSGISPVPCL